VSDISPRQRRIAVLSSVTVVAIWSGSGVFSHFATGTSTTLQAAWLESLCGLGFVTIVALASRVQRLFRVLRPRDFLRITILGLLAHTGYYAFLFLGFSAGYPIQTMALNYTWAVFMVIFGVAINHVSLTWDRAASVLLGAAGAAIVILPEFTELARFSPGALAGLGAGFCFGLFTPLSVRWGYDPRLVTWWMLAVSLGVFSALLVVTNTPLAFAWKGLLGAAYMGVGVDGIGYVLWQRANRVLPAWLLAVWVCVIPVVNIALLAIVFRFPMHRNVLLGATLIGTGIVFQHGVAIVRRRHGSDDGGVDVRTPNLNNS
jgi:drug/metabolite transporter (DMT)-like permease